MKIKEQTRKLAVGCSKHCFEVVYKTDEVSNHIYGKATLTWFKEIFEEYEMFHFLEVKFQLLSINSSTSSSTKVSSRVTLIQ